MTTNDSTKSTTKDSINSEIADWLGDIVALESHVEEAMDAQLKLKGDLALTGAIKQFHDSVRDSKKRAVEFQASYGSEPGNPVIKAGTTVLGKAAGLIDKLRHDSISKAIRDDYTAFNHLAIAYTMLHTTAMAFDDHQVMQFAEQGLRTYARLVQKINQVIPDAVLFDLQAGEHAPVLKTNVADDCRATIESIWKSTSDA
jgi:ferritin-like metal-binding protein YciE